MRCHYEVLGIPLDATVDDIKKAYRKCALQWHPDKHGENKEEANKKFLEIQDAYETLSNDQERAWYDSHREIIINGGTPGDPNDANYTFNVYPYFTSSCFKGFGDDENGFYTVYREMFAKIAEEDRAYYDKETNIPDFGYSDSDYDTVVAAFYAFWLSYCTPRSFVWVEEHDIREAQDRYVRRIMDKENKKLRDKAKKERNEEIRKIVEFVRKKDKRVEQYKKLLEEKNLLAQKKAKEKKEADRLRRVEQMKNYVEPDWSAIDRQLEELELQYENMGKKSSTKSKATTSASNIEETNEEEDKDDENNETVDGNDENDELASEEDEYDDSLFCVACNKGFKSAKSFSNHEKSKKHKENVELLKKLMKDENDSMFADQNNEEQSEDEEDKKNEEKTKTKLSKKQKKKRKQNKKFNDDSDSNNENENEDQVADEQKENETPIATSTADLEDVEKNDQDKASTTKKENKKSTILKNKETHETNETNETEPTAKSLKCSVCDDEFDTRNKLFEHIKKEGHAALKTVDANDKPLSHNAMKKNKRMAKAAKNK